MNGTITTYTYNPDGTRHSKTVSTGPSPTTIYVWQGGNMVAELNISGTIKATYTYGTSLICSNDGTKTKYYLFNAHGDVTGLANTNGYVVKSYQYDAFGN